MFLFFFLINCRRKVWWRFKHVINTSHTRTKSHFCNIWSPDGVDYRFF